MQRRPWVPIALAVLVVPCLSPATAGWIERKCGIEVTSELTSEQRVEDSVRLEFAVQIAGGEECSLVSYDLVLEELLPNGQWKAVREARRIEMVGGSASERVEHRISSELRLLGHQVKLVDCEKCPSGG